MPNKASAKKALRQTKRITAVHVKVKDELKRALKKTRRLSNAKSEESKKILNETTRLIDKAVRKKLLKKNTAARTKSRLMKALNKKIS